MVWFLPSMLALLTLKSVWYNSNKAVKWVMLILSIALWILTVFGVLSKSTIGKQVPFSLSNAFYFLLLGLIARLVVEKRFPAKYQCPIVLVLTLAMTILFYLQSTMQWHSIVDLHTIFLLVMPVLMFLLLQGISDVIKKSRLLIFIGKYSLQIYIVHVFILNALEWGFTHFLKPSIGIGVVIYIMALAISAGLAILMVKVPIINKIMFPKSE